MRCKNHQYFDSQQAANFVKGKGDLPKHVSFADGTSLDCV